MASLQRAHGRAHDSLRPVSIEVGPMKYAEGSALIEMGDTRVLVAASIENRVPPFLFDSGKGWATAEYAMLPRATSTRSTREVVRGRPAGRSAEIQRLIGRSVRAVLDLEAFPERTLTLDCDVLQADGGTRTAAITGAYVAAAQALAQLFLTGDLPRWPFTGQVAAISVGVVGGVPLLDLDAPEDQSAEVDLNVVGTATGELVEVQGTGESRSFHRKELDDLLDLALAGIAELTRQQDSALAGVLDGVDEVKNKGTRRPAAPMDERELWGKPD
ncbi:MAG: ribonuclease PH [Acidobacteria bacterium]|nr:MAG: ribonuclease PH [Acidobacteriota bacterium]